MKISITCTCGRTDEIAIVDISEDGNKFELNDTKSNFTLFGYSDYRVGIECNACGREARVE
ncbi:hypothetical protein EalM132_00163 [Exiguobacterium phage vB_EalM-132]|nr:hypothetical protein EalM132_00163 [Exiguobacterium phage vB_EalM-132]